MPAKVSGRNAYVGNQACAPCHSAIYKSYQGTSMAHASGPAISGLIPADFTHKDSGVHYRIYTENGRAWLSFDRPGDPELRGTRELRYYIGLGRRGLTYLFETDGFLFESPVNWYANKQMWDTAPAYQTAREDPLNLPAYTSCLRCHVSGMQGPTKGTDNHYPEPPFTQNGVACERRHGPGGAHVNGGAIVNPAKLTPARRDDICMQCHLEGKAAIERPGRHAYEFQAGEALSDYVRYFVLRALAKDPTLVDAATNLGVIEAQSGDLQGALKLWQNAFQRTPARSSIALNIVRAYCATGKFSEARTYTVRVLEFNPDLSSARKLLQSLSRSPASCSN